MSYTQLAQKQRYQYIRYEMRWLPTKLNRRRAFVSNPSTVGGELSRNAGKRGYRPQQARQKPQTRRRAKTGKRISYNSSQVPSQREKPAPEKKIIAMAGAIADLDWIYRCVLSRAKRAVFSFVWKSALLARLKTRILPDIDSKTALIDSFYGFGRKTPRSLSFCAFPNARASALIALLIIVPCLKNANLL